MRETLIYLSHLDHDDTEKQVKVYDFTIFTSFLLKENKLVNT